ncbi:MAG: DUF4037 domain-containing protein [Spirochaetia bacterium]
MSRKIESAIQKVKDTLSTWESIDTITLIRMGKDLFEPYFFLSLDVYYQNPIPDLEERIDRFGEYAGAFEASEISPKDRFFVDDIPFRVEYKNISRFNQIIDGSSGFTPAFRDTGTYIFYRVLESEILLKRSEWLNDYRKKLSEISPEFWQEIRNIFQTRMEHALSDLLAASIQRDNLFYLVSSSAYIRSVCSVLFARNQRFEPSARMLMKETLELPVLPEQFKGRFDSFLRNDGGIDIERRSEIAELLAKSILGL